MVRIRWKLSPINFLISSGVFLKFFLANINQQFGLFCVQILLSAVAEVTAENISGPTALYLAIFNGDKEIIDMLTKTGSVKVPYSQAFNSTSLDSLKTVKIVSLFIFLFCV